LPHLQAHSRRLLSHRTPSDTHGRLDQGHGQGGKKAEALGIPPDALRGIVVAGAGKLLSKGGPFMGFLYFIKRAFLHLAYGWLPLGGKLQEPFRIPMREHLQIRPAYGSGI